MKRMMQRLWMMLALGSLGLGSCSHQVESPQPTGSKVQPDLVCNAKPADRELSNVVIRGEKFTPMPSKTLEGDNSAQLILPKIELSQTRDLAGGALTTSQLVLADDPANPAASLVHWRSEQEMSFDIKPANNVPTGVYTIKVTNPDGQRAATIETVLAVLPPPAISQLVPPAICDDQTDQLVEIQGTNFLRYEDEQGTVHWPTVTLSGGGLEAKEYTAHQADGCVQVTGNFVEKKVELCTSITITIKQGDYKVETITKLDLVVTNPAPANCASSDAIQLTIQPPPTVTGVQPQKVCEGGSVIAVSGKNFLPGAEVTLRCPDGATTKDYPASSTQVNPDGTGITATFGPGPAAGIECEVIVRNQDSCEDRPLPHQKINVVTGPILFYVDPGVVFNGVTTNITLFSTAISPPLPADAVAIIPNPNTNNVAPIVLTFIYTANQKYPNRVQAIVPKDTPAGEYDVTLKDDSDCFATLLKGLRITDQKTVTMTSIVPPFGWTQEDTAVQLNGTPFVATPRVFLNPVGGAATDPAVEMVSVSFGSANRVTGVVPKGTPVKQYDVILVNPDGTVGVLEGGYTEVENAPPVILSATPASIVSAPGQVVRLDGLNFSNPNTVTLACKHADYTDVTPPPAVQTGAPTCTGTACTETITIDGSTLTAGDICVVRLTNGDTTYGEYSAIGVTGPSLNLNNPHAGTDMNVGRRGLAASAGNATPVARFVYAIGGDDGQTSGALDSTEFAPVDLYGVMGNWTSQKYLLGSKRTMTAAATVGRYIYLVGGDNGAGPVATAERAMILSPREAPEITDVDLTLSGAVPDAGTTPGLDGGEWHYKVSALFDAADTDNPGGESLPSDEFSLKLPVIANKKISVKLFWSAPLDGLGDPLPNVSGYRIYRTALDGAPGTETLLAEVTGAATLEYLDDGSATLGTDTPLPQGSTGKWWKLPDMGMARSGLAVVAGFEPGSATQFYVYALMGNTGGTNLTGTYEFLPVSIAANGRQTVGAAWTPGQSASTTARWQAAAWVVDDKVSALIPAATTYIYIGGGLSTGSVEAGKIAAGGDLGAWDPIPVDFKSGNEGYGAFAANNQLFTFGGGETNPSGGARSAHLAPPPALPPSLESNAWNNEGLQMTQPRYLLGSAVQSAFVFLIGGKTGTEQATKTTELVVW